MELSKFYAFSLVFFLAGCTTTGKTVSKDLQKDNSIYRQGYKDGVKKNIQGIVEKLNGNDFPYYGDWSEPIIQEVKVPASIQNGVFIPEHYQTVLIKPGEWKKNQAYPIKAEKMENKDNENILNNLNVNVNDITVMPKQYSVRPEDDITK